MAGEIGIKEWLEEVISNVKNQITDFSEKQRIADESLALLREEIRDQIEAVRQEVMGELEEIREMCHSNDKAVGNMDTKIRAYFGAATVAGGILAFILKFAWDVYSKIPLPPN